MLAPPQWAPRSSIRILHSNTAPAPRLQHTQDQPLGFHHPRSSLPQRCRPHTATHTARIHSPTPGSHSFKKTVSCVFAVERPRNAGRCGLTSVFQHPPIRQPVWLDLGGSTHYKISPGVGRETPHELLIATVHPLRPCCPLKSDRPRPPMAQKRNEETERALPLIRRAIHRLGREGNRRGV